ncbi:MAG: hypothetical protein HOG49_24210, partial [Candidatus Scalindua sp.]|nr:hypothetical protein [Candidatus Scalindua sp.]
SLIASSRYILDDAAGFESSNLLLDEVDDLRPALYEKISDEAEETVFTKVHDAYTFLPDGRPLLSVDATLGAIYLLRNPLDIAPSFANHSSCGIDEIIADMNNVKNAFCATPNNLPNQLRQHLLNWSGHVLSWVDAPNIKVHVVRYEDMKQKPLETFYGAVRFAGLERTEEEVVSAIKNSSFEYLKKQEEEEGFCEKGAKCASFFRRGEVGSWKGVLSDEQVVRIVRKHGIVMRRFGYISDEENNDNVLPARDSNARRAVKSRKYSLYGLTVSSPFQCPELVPAKGRNKDITIKFGEIEENRYDWNIEGLCYKAAQEKFFLSVKGIAKYLVTGGSEIIIEKHGNTEDDAVRLFLYDTVIAAALMQRGLLPLHGSVAVRNGKGIAFLGSSSVGKSIIAAALNERSCSVLSDTLCVVDFHRRPMVYPGYPFLMLWRGGAKILGLELQGRKPVRKGLMKYYFPLDGSFHNQAVPLEKIYLLNSHNREEYTFTPVNGSDKLFALQDYIYKETLVRSMGFENIQFQKCVKTARHTVIKRINYHNDKRRLGKLIDFLEKDFL